jgi:hypothetical protein
MASSVETESNEKATTPPKESPMEMLFNIDSLTGGQMPMELVKRITFVAGLIIIYIYYTMLAEGRMHQIVETKQQLEEIRADYTTQKADYMKVGKQSYLAIAMRRYGLQVSLTPPIKVVADPVKEN